MNARVEESPRGPALVPFFFFYICAQRRVLNPYRRLPAENKMGRRLVTEGANQICAFLFAGCEIKFGAFFSLSSRHISPVPS